MSTFSVSQGIGDPRVSQVWRNERRSAYGSLRFGEELDAPWLTFTSPADARAVAAACIACAEAMEALPPVDETGSREERPEGSTT